MILAQLGQAQIHQSWQDPPYYGDLRPSGSKYLPQTKFNLRNERVRKIIKNMQNFYKRKFKVHF